MISISIGNQYAYLIGMQYNGKAVVTAAGNVNFREQTPGYLPVMAIERGANIELQAQVQVIHNKSCQPRMVRRRCSRRMKLIG